MDSELTHRLRLGLPTLDAVRYSAAPAPVERLTLFSGGLALFEQPRMPDVHAVQAPGTGGDVIIRLADAIPRLERPVARDLPERSLHEKGVLLIPEGLATEYHSTTGQPRCLHLHLPAGMREQWGEDLGRTPMRARANLRDRELDMLFAGIAVELRGEHAFSRLKLQGLAIAVIARALHLSASDGPRRPATRAMTAARLRRVRAYVEDNLAETICLEDMAAAVGLSPSHFSRAFRAETGMSPYAWVVERRVERVKTLLLGDRRRLADIAADSGFATQSHMTETFRRVTGMPPLRWLREVGRPPAACEGP